MTADPDIDLIFTSSDFLFPTIRSVLEPRGMWKKTGEDGHVLMAGLDGDDAACQLIKDGYVDATGVQDLYFEAELALTAILARSRRARRSRTRCGTRASRSADNLGEAQRWGCWCLRAPADGAPRAS